MVLRHACDKLIAVKWITQQKLLTADLNWSRKRKWVSEYFKSFGHFSLERQWTSQLAPPTVVNCVPFRLSDCRPCTLLFLYTGTTMSGEFLCIPPFNRSRFLLFWLVDHTELTQGFPQFTPWCGSVQRRWLDLLHLCRTYLNQFYNRYCIVSGQCLFFLWIY